MFAFLFSRTELATLSRPTPGTRSARALISILREYPAHKKHLPDLGPGTNSPDRGKRTASEKPTKSHGAIVSDRRGQKYIKMCAIHENALMRSAIDHDIESNFPMWMEPGLGFRLPRADRIRRQDRLLSVITASRTQPQPSRCCTEPRPPSRREPRRPMHIPSTER